MVAIVGIRDVAQAAGVSVSTVSHVVNGTRFVSPETRAAVQSAIDRLGYRPSHMAQAMRGKGSRSIGMLVSSNANPFFAQVVSGVEEGCYRARYSLVLSNTGEDPGRQYESLRALSYRRIDALAVMTVCRDKGFETALKLLDMPCVVLDAEPTRWLNVVGDESGLGGRLAARRLIAAGFHDIACLAGPEGHPRSQARLRGMAAALEEAGLSLPSDRVAHAALSAPGGHDAMTRMLDRGPAPEAVFAFNDLMALGVYSALAERGLSVPGDVSVIGYDDLELAAYLVPPLTTIRQPGFEMGLAAAQALIAHLDEGTELPAAIRRTPELIERASVRAG